MSRPFLMFGKVTFDAYANALKKYYKGDKSNTLTCLEPCLE